MRRVFWPVPVNDVTKKNSKAAAELLQLRRESDRNATAETLFDFATADDLQDDDIAEPGPSPRSATTTALPPPGDASDVYEFFGVSAPESSSGSSDDESSSDDDTAPPPPHVTARTLVLKGHTKQVTCLAALAGDRLASCSYRPGDPIIIWNLADGTQLAKLSGNSKMVLSLLVLDDGRLASGGGTDGDGEVFIWNLADTRQPQAKLRGHEAYVNCLAALDGDRLASGGDGIIIWSVANSTQLDKLEGHTEEVCCLAALDCDRLVSGSNDKSIIIWNLASDPPALSHKRMHPGPVCCLAVLGGDRLACRLASGTRFGPIIIFNVASNRLAFSHQLKGHTNVVTSLAALDGDRLASGSYDKSVIIWNLADGAQLTKLEGHINGVTCLAALDGGRLASGSRDETIRVRPLAKLADLAACGSTFEFEKVARSHQDKSCLADLFTAAVVQFEENMGDSTSAAIRQAHAFDAIAKVINAGKDQDEAIDSLVPSVLALVRDDALLPDMSRRGVSNAAIQELAQSPLFRVVLDAKFAEGPVIVLYFELFLFLVLGCCFTRVAAFEVLGVSKWFAAEMIAEIVAAFVILAWFSARELYQMWSTRAIELTTPEYPFALGKGLNFGLGFYALAIPRYILLFLVCLVQLPVYLVTKKSDILFHPRTLPEDVVFARGFSQHFKHQGAHLLLCLHSPTATGIIHDPLTFLGFPRAWRHDYWNVIDAATIGCAWAAFACAAMPGRHLSADLAVVTAILMWIRFCWYLKNLRLGWAKFVLMIEQIAWDLRYYMVYFSVVLMMFASAFYLYLGPRKSDEFGFHDDGAPSAFGTFPYTIYNLILLGFVGEFDPDNFDEVVVRCLLVFYVLVVMVVLLNVLIAIVSDSYDISMAKAEALYYRSRLELITEMAPIASRLPKLPKWMQPEATKRLADARTLVDALKARAVPANLDEAAAARAKLADAQKKLLDALAAQEAAAEALIKKRITKALAHLKKAKSHDPHRVNYMINRVATIVDHSERQTGHRIDAVETELAEIKAMLQSLIDNRGS